MTVKEFVKSVRIRRSYGQENSGTYVSLASDTIFSPPQQPEILTVSLSHSRAARGPTKIVIMCPK